MEEVGLDLVSSQQTLISIEHDGTGGCIRRDGRWVGPEEGRKVDRGARRHGRGSGRVVTAKSIVLLDRHVLMGLVVHVIIVFAAAVPSGNGAISIVVIRNRIVRADGIGPGDGQEGRRFKRLGMLMFRGRCAAFNDCWSIRRILDRSFHRCNAVGLSEDLLVAGKRHIVAFAAAHFAAAGRGETELPAGAAVCKQLR